VAAILRPHAPDPEEREFPKNPHLIQRFFRRLTRDGSRRACVNRPTLVAPLRTICYG